MKNIIEKLEFVSSYCEHLDYTLDSSWSSVQAVNEELSLLIFSYLKDKPILEWDRLINLIQSNKKTFEALRTYHTNYISEMRTLFQKLIETNK